jgi:hypothetical protein
MANVVIQFATVGPAGQVVGICGLRTVPVCEGGVGIGFGKTSTWKYDAPLVLSTNATFVPSTESVGEV